MDRRGVLLAVGTACSALSGCAGRIGDESSTPTASASQADSATTADLQQKNHLTIGLANRDTTQSSVEVTVTRDGEPRFDRRLTLDAAATQDIALQIYEPERYTVSAVVDGEREDSVSVWLDAYDIKLGPVVLIAITEDALVLTADKR